jgi:hypothetical protein
VTHRSRREIERALADLADVAGDRADSVDTRGAVTADFVTYDERVPGADLAPSLAVSEVVAGDAGARFVVVEAADAGRGGS